MMIRVVLVVLLVVPAKASSEETDSSTAASARFLQQLDSETTSGDSREAIRGALASWLRESRRQVNEDDVHAWRTLASLEDWNEFRAPRLDALKQSLGEFPDPPEDLHVQVTRTIAGDGFEIDCLVFESRPGLLVTANLYRPVRARQKRPGILICHSHHNPKTQGELQDMGMTWARAGCLVLIMDQLGHGERRQHPFRTEADYDGDFRVGRQDYYFRYNVGMQLHLIGDSLIGWMVWDLMRGVDLLLEQPGIDPERIALLGAVAGGGDPCAVTAALDPRIAVAVPFNFGGPQPENVFPLPEDAELSFNYVGGGSWESTRNLRLSARDGFLPWVIVGSIAPRGLIYAHEFSWDRERDPVWRRLQTLYRWSDRPDHLASLLGYGRVQLPSSEASHCNNIGAFHREQIHPVFERWLGIPPPDPEYSKRLDASDLYCVEGVSAAVGIALPRVQELANQVAEERIAHARDRLKQLPAEERRASVRAAWSDVLGYEPPQQPMQAEHVETEEVSRADQPPLRCIKILLRSDRLTTPLLLLVPERIPEGGSPCVVGIAQSGKAGFLAYRPDGIAKLLENGIAVCLPDLPACGEVSPGTYRGRRSAMTGISSTRLMLGGTILGDQLRELMGVLQWLRTRDEIDGERLAIWGDSFSPVNPPDRNIAVPLDADDEPERAEPMGAMLSLLAALFDAEVKAVLARNGLVSLRSLLDSQFVHIPHDFVVPGALRVGDLPEITLAIAPVPVRIDGCVDGTNRRVSVPIIERDWADLSGQTTPIPISAQPTADAVRWLMRAIRSAKKKDARR